LEVEVRIQKLEKKVKALREEIDRLVPHLRDTHLFEDAKQFCLRVWRLDLHCTACHFSLLEGYKIDEGHIAELEADYEAIRLFSMNTDPASYNVSLVISFFSKDRHYRWDYRLKFRPRNLVSLGYEGIARLITLATL
jgi:hypothetical protein